MQNTQNPKWCVIDVEPTTNYELILTFEYGEKKKFDMKPLLHKKEQLKDISFFLKAHVVYDTVGWNDDLDIAPEFLYENSVPIEN